MESLQFEAGGEGIIKKDVELWAVMKVRQFVEHFYVAVNTLKTVQNLIYRA